MKLPVALYKWEYRLGWLSFVFLILVFLGLAIPSGPIGIGAILLLLVLLLLIPRGTWWLLVEKLGTSILVPVLALDRAVLRLSQRQTTLKPIYFFTQPSSPRRLWSRSAQVLLLVFFSSSLASPRITLLTPQDATNQFTEFVILGILFLSVLSPTLLSIWAYQDSGLRRCETGEAVVMPVGRSVSAVLAGLGTLGTFYRFASSVASTSGEAFAFGAASAIVLSPSCLLLTSTFHRKAMPKLVERMRQSSSATRLGFKQVSIGP